MSSGEWKTVSRRDKKSRQEDRLHAQIDIEQIVTALRQGCCLRFGPEHSLELYFSTPPDQLSTDLRRTCWVKFPGCTRRHFDYCQPAAHPLARLREDNYLLDDNFISIQRFTENLTSGIYITSSPRANCVEFHERPPRAWEYHRRPILFAQFQIPDQPSYEEDYEVGSPLLEAIGSIDDLWAD